MANCEFKNGCTVARLYQKRLDLIHNKTEIYIQITVGPNDLNFVNSKMDQANLIKQAIDNVDMQIGAQIICAKCPWR